MNQFQAAEKYGVTHEQILSIDAWFLQSPIPLKKFDLTKSLPFMSAKLNLSEEETLELLQDRLDSVMRTQRINRIIKWSVIIIVGFIIYYFTQQ